MAIPEVKFNDFKRNPQDLVMLGVGIALLYKAKNKYMYGKIYCSNKEVNDKLGKGRFIDGPVSSSEAYESYITLLLSQAIASFLSFWRPEWGNLRVELSVRNKEWKEVDLFYF